MKALVTYYSETGNTAKVAQEIYNGLETENKSIKEIHEVGAIVGCDIIFCGFPVLEHSVPLKMQDFLKKIPKDSKIAFFATHGCLRGGAKATTAFESAMTLVQGSKVLGTFGVRGKVKPAVIEALETKPEHKAWAEEAASAVDHPDTADLKDAAVFANSMLDKIRSHFG